MKKINLRGISESLNEEELKNVVGGSQGGVGGMDSMQVMPDDDGGSVAVAGQLSPKQEACKDKPIGASCSFKDNRGVTQYGKCVSFYGRPKHCSDLN
jgi:natural product precursor